MNSNWTWVRRSLDARVLGASVVCHRARNEAGRMFTVSRDVHDYAGRVVLLAVSINVDDCP